VDFAAVYSAFGKVGGVVSIMVVMTIIVKRPTKHVVTYYSWKEH
jgi:hypothetical protein